MLLEFIKQALAGPHAFSSTQLDLPNDIARRMHAMARDIKETDLVETEGSPHITIKYGLHTTDPQPVRTLLGHEPPVRVKFGKTECFAGESGDCDVVYVRVFSPDIRRLHDKLTGALAHTTTHPKYTPHATIAYVRKGAGHKYCGRTDLEGVEATIDVVKFCRPSGRKAIIELRKSASASDYLNSAPALMVGGGLGGAALGRYLVAPLLSRLLGLNRDDAKRALTTLGAALGTVPGAALGLQRRQLRGSFFAPGGPPRNAGERLRELRHGMRFGVSAFPRTVLESEPDFQRVMGRLPLDARNAVADVFDKSSNHDPAIYSRELWKPTFPVAMAMDDIANNPFIPLTQSAKMKQLVAESGRQQGVGLTGEASPGALMAALPNVVRHAAPTAAGAWVVAKLLGAPTGLKRTAVGAAAIYGALRGFMSKDASLPFTVTDDGVVGAMDLRKLSLRDADGRIVGSVKTYLDSVSKRAVVDGLNVARRYRGQGLGRKLLFAAENKRAGWPMALRVSGFAAPSVSDAEFADWYARVGYRPRGDWMIKER